MSSGSEGDVVESMYDAALGHRSWGDVSGGLLGSLDGLTLNLFVHGRRSAAVEVVANVGASPEHLRLYAEHFAQHDLWATGALEQRLFGKAMMGSWVVEDHVLERSLIYNEFLRPIANV